MPVHAVHINAPAVIQHIHIHMNDHNFIACKQTVSQCVWQSPDQVGQTVMSNESQMHRWPPSQQRSRVLLKCHHDHTLNDLPHDLLLTHCLKYEPGNGLLSSHMPSCPAWDVGGG